MAGNDTAALVVSLSAQLTKFQKDMDDALGVADKGVKKIEDRFSKLNPHTEGLFGDFDLAASAAGIGLIINKMQELVTQVGHLANEAQRVGLTTDQFQQLRFAVVTTGGDVSQADSAMARFSRSISDAARGSGELYKVFQLNKVSLRDISGNLLPANDLLGKYADLIKNAKNPQDAMNLAVLAFGRGAGPEMVNALRGGAEGLHHFGEEAKTAGVILDKELVQRAKELDDKFQILQLRIGSVLKGLAVGGSSFFDDLLTSLKASLGSADALLPRIEAIQKQIERTKRLDPQLQGSLPQLEEELRLMQSLVGAENTLRKLRGEAPLQITVNKPTPGAPTIIPDVQDEEFRKLLEKSRERQALLNAEAQAIGQTVDVAARYKTIIELESQAKIQNIPLTDERRKKIIEEADAVGAATLRLQEYKVRWDGINEAARFFGSITGDFLDVLTDKTKNFNDVAVSALRNFAKELQKAALTGEGSLAKLLGLASSVPGGTGGLFGALLKAFGSSGGSSGGSLSTSGASALSFGLAGGTDNWRGGPTWVGESGPEIINLPKGSQVIPNNVATRGGGGDINVMIGGPVVNIKGDASENTIALIQQSWKEYDRSIQGKVVLALNDAKRRSVRV